MDLGKYEVIPAEKFSCKDEAWVMIADGYVQLNKVAYDWLKQGEYYTIEFDRVKKELKILQSMDAKSGTIFGSNRRATYNTELIYQIMGWERGFRYRVVGLRNMWDTDPYLQFDLRGCLRIRANENHELPETNENKASGQEGGRENMLKVDDRFKMWMRTRLRNKEYAERVLRVVTELDDAVLEDVWAHAAFPDGYAASHDPEAMVGYLKGYVPSISRDILVGIFGKWEDFEDLMMPYTWLLWNMEPVITPEDEANLPILYMIAFRNIDRDEPISHVRWRDQDGEEATCFGFDKQKINIINTSVDSDVIRIITGGEKTEMEAK